MTTQETLKESNRLADRRLPLEKELEESQHLLYEMLEARGYTITKVHLVWAIVSKPVTHQGTQVQLEIDPEGSNLDIILLSDATKELGGGFPLGGSWACKSSVKLTYDNIRFAANRIEEFFGVINEGDQYAAQTWASVQSQLRYEESLRKQK
jgi:hypothetical protein